MTGKTHGRPAFTLIELLVVMAIIAVLIAILLPAVQKVREAASRTTCINNMKQLCLAVLNFEAGSKHLPSPGEGIDPNAVGTKYYEKHSTFTHLLPYIEQENTYRAIDLSKDYNHPVNQAAAKSHVPTFICPSAVGLENDPYGYGQISYMIISYTDIDITTGLRNTSAPVRAAGALRMYGNGGGVYDKNGVWYTLAQKPQFNQNYLTMSGVSDGTSNTIMITECANWRNHQTIWPYQFSSAVDPYVLSLGGGAANDGGLADFTGHRALNRWADPEASSNGVSGPPYADPASAQFLAGTTSYAGPWINQTMVPLGGTGTLPGQATWAMNNCGPNDEPNGPHGGGVVTGFVDGHVIFLRDTVSAATLYRLIHPRDGAIVDMSDAQ